MLPTPWFVPISVVLIIAARRLWVRRPGVWTCALFWASGIAFVLTMAANSALSLGLLTMALGICCNALVTLANGGRMPVRGPMRPHGVWVPRTSQHYFAWLGDNYRFFRTGRLSVGDMLIVSGICLSLIPNLIT